MVTKQNNDAQKKKKQEKSTKQPGFGDRRK